MCADWGTVICFPVHQTEGFKVWPHLGFQMAKPATDGPFLEPEVFTFLGLSETTFLLKLKPMRTPGRPPGKHCCYVIFCFSPPCRCLLVKPPWDGSLAQCFVDWALLFAGKHTGEVLLLLKRVVLVFLLWPVQLQAPCVVILLSFYFHIKWTWATLLLRQGVGVICHEVVLWLSTGMGKSLGSMLFPEASTHWK